MCLDWLKQTQRQLKTKFYKPRSFLSRDLPDPFKHKISPDPNFFYWREWAMLFLVLWEVCMHQGLDLPLNSDQNKNNNWRKNIFLNNNNNKKTPQKFRKRFKRTKIGYILFCLRARSDFMPKDGINAVQTTRHYWFILERLPWAMRALTEGLE